MKWVWTWGGQCFGYVDGEDLWTYSGKHVGRLQGTDIYGPDGRYLCEIMNGNRLITNRGKSGWTGYSFAPWGRRGGFAPYANYTGYAMYAGFDDFPHPDSL